VFNLVILVGTLRASLEDPLTWILIAIVAAIAIYRRPFWMALLVAAGSAVIHLALIFPSVKSAGLVILILAVKLVWTCATFAFTRIALRLVQRA
jgi:hypothetical protein